MLHTKQCKFSFNECVAKIIEAIKKGGAEVFAQIDHSENAKKVNLSLPNTLLIVFGNPSAGTLLMMKNREVGFDLPLRILVWEQEGKTFISYKLPSEIAMDYGIQADVLRKMDEFMSIVISQVT